jgi:hypothetical protein
MIASPARRVVLICELVALRTLIIQAMCKEPAI